MAARSRVPAAGAESAQGTPVEPAAPVAGALLVRDEAGRYGLLVQPGEVFWLGQPARCDLVLRPVGHRFPCDAFHCATCERIAGQ